MLRFFLLFETGSQGSYPWLAWNSEIHLLVSGSRVLGLKVCIPMPGPLLYTSPSPSVSDNLSIAGCLVASIHYVPAIILKFLIPKNTFRGLKYSIVEYSAHLSCLRPWYLGSIPRYTLNKPNQTIKTTTNLCAHVYF